MTPAAEMGVGVVDGGQTKVRIPEGTQSGTTFRLKGKGIPYVGYKNRGDQYVTVRPVLPSSPDGEFEEFIRRWYEAHPHDPRSSLASETE